MPFENGSRNSGALILIEARPRYETKEKKNYLLYRLTPLFVSYLIRNRTLQVQEIDVTVEPSDAFMYSGHKQVSSAYLLHVKHVSCEGVWWNNILEEVYYWLLRCDWPVKLPISFAIYLRETWAEFARSQRNFVNSC